MMQNRPIPYGNGAVLSGLFGFFNPHHLNGF